MLQYGNEWVAPEFKEAFLQGLREGAAPVPATPHQGGFIYRDPRTRATLAKVTILVWTILGALVTSIDLATPDSAPDEFTAADGALAFFGLAMLPTFILSVVFFCMWTHRVMANSYALGGKWNEITPGWAVGWYFIPFANLVKPYHGLKQAWQSTHDDPDVPALLPTWWGLWIVSNIAGNISMRLTMNDMPEAATMVDMITLAIDFPLLYCVWQVISRLTNQQISKVAG